MSSNFVKIVVVACCLSGTQNGHANTIDTVALCGNASQCVYTSQAAFVAAIGSNPLGQENFAEYTASVISSHVIVGRSPGALLGYISSAASTPRTRHRMARVITPMVVVGWGYIHSEGVTSDSTIKVKVSGRNKIHLGLTGTKKLLSNSQNL